MFVSSKAVCSGSLFYCCIHATPIQTEKRITPTLWVGLTKLRATENSFMC